MSLNHHPNLTLNHLHASTNASSSSSSSSYRLFSLQDDQEEAYVHPFIESKPSLHPHDHEVVGDVALESKKEISDLKLTILKSSYNQDHHNNGTTSSSPPLKMKLFPKSKKSNDYQTIHDQNSNRVDYSPSSPRRESNNNGEDSSNNNEGFGSIRACFDCGTTRTPLWRSGPHGPKSLCNACGIRQRKARRAAMAASSDTTCASTNNNNTTTKLNLFKEIGAPKIMKKRSKIHATKPTLTTTNDNDNGNGNDDWSSQKTKRICVQELSKNLSLHQFFPQDEKEAAILLMALSSGFVEG